jgi:hypothetical protein
MDIRCPKCGEPWDMDCLHDEVEHRNGGLAASFRRPYEVEYNEVSADFRSRGCVALGSYAATCNKTTATPVIAAVYDVLGDDMDGAASMFEDMDEDMEHYLWDVL